MTEAAFIGAIPQSSGIYLISHRASASVYVGQSLNIRIRLGQHYQMLVSRTHYNKPLQHLWNTHPPESFSVSLHMGCPQGLSPLARQRWLVKAERQATQTLKKGNTVLNRIDPEIVETPDALAEFKELEAAQDKANKGKATSISRQRRDMKQQLEQLHQRLAPLRIQRGGYAAEIAQREEALRKSRRFFCQLFGSRRAEPVSEQEERLAALKAQLRQLDAALKPDEQECVRLTEKYRRLYFSFPKVQQQLDKRLNRTLFRAYTSGKRPTITED